MTPKAKALLADLGANVVHGVMTVYEHWYSNPEVQKEIEVMPDLIMCPEFADSTFSVGIALGKVSSEAMVEPMRSLQKELIESATSDAPPEQSLDLKTKKGYPGQDVILDFWRSRDLEEKQSIARHMRDTGGIDIDSIDEKNPLFLYVVWLWYEKFPQISPGCN